MSIETTYVPGIIVRVRLDNPRPGVLEWLIGYDKSLRTATFPATVAADRESAAGAFAAWIATMGPAWQGRWNQYQAVGIVGADWIFARATEADWPSVQGEGGAP